MKRRVEGLSSSVKAAKKRSWREEAEDDAGGSADDAPGKPPPPAAPVRKVVRAPAPKPPGPPGDEIDELDAALDAALEGGDEDGARPPPPPGGGANPVVWMELSVAGKPRGRVFLELFRDVVPQTAENFRLLCLGASPGGRAVGYKGTELHKVVPGKVVEGGEFDCSASGKDFADESFRLTHSRAGLLSMAGAGPDANASRFQVVLRPSPELDNKQVVFGQILPAGPDGPVADRLHPLHWVEAVGTSRTGTPREAVVVEDCGELAPAEAAKLVGPRPRDDEAQAERYSRGGLRPPKLTDSVLRENLADVLELTADCLESLEWETKKAERASDRDRAQEIEASLKPLGMALEEAKYKAGTVTGDRGIHGRKAQSQQLRLRDLQEALQKLY